MKICKWDSGNIMVVNNFHWASSIYFYGLSNNAAQGILDQARVHTLTYARAIRPTKTDL